MPSSRSTFSNQKVLLASSAGIAIVAIATIIFRQYRKSNPNKKDNDGDAAAGFGYKVPGHLRRLLHKEHRRKESVRFLAMKKPMYDNIEMYSPDDTLLCTISDKKAAWYIRKNLAAWKVETKSIQLLFEPKGQPSSESNTYNQTHKKNVCVVCGDSKDFMRHYVVPYCYRTLLPDKYKTHMPHDIVILCPDCHLHSDQATQRRQKEMEESLRRYPGSDRPNIPDHALKSVRSAASALCQRRDQIPLDKVKAYENLIKQHFGLDESAWLSKELLEEATTMETSLPNPTYIPGPYLVVSSLAYDEASIRNFILGWREHFIQTMQPRFLPTGWSVESPVHTGEF